MWEPFGAVLHDCSLSCRTRPNLPTPGRRRRGRPSPAAWAAAGRGPGSCRECVDGEPGSPGSRVRAGGRRQGPQPCCPRSQRQRSSARAAAAVHGPGVIGSVRTQRAVSCMHDMQLPGPCHRDDLLLCRPMLAASNAAARQLFQVATDRQLHLLLESHVQQDAMLAAMLQVRLPRPWLACMEWRQHASSVYVAVPSSCHRRS
jgi:hypothetical protein